MLRARLLCRGNAATCLSGARNHAPTSVAAFTVDSSRPSSTWSNQYGRCTASRLPCAYVNPQLSPLTSSLAKGWCSHTPVNYGRTFASRPKHKSSKRVNKRKERAERDSEPRTPYDQHKEYTPAYVETLIKLRDAITNVDVRGMHIAYRDIQGAVRLGGDDVAAIAQALHTALRGIRPDSKGNRDLTQLLALADTLVVDIKDGKIPPSHVAHLHILAFYKEAVHLEEGHEFWTWLVSRDDSYVNPAVYGAAIELLAVQGQPAEVTESLYMQALKRFPGSFNEYHLSDDAVLADRDRPINIVGIPVTLLQGILTARLLRGDSKSAYMTLDTALRLFPTQLPSRFFTLFIEERPVPEAYKVFMMACRSGTTLSSDSLRSLLSRLRTIVVADPLANAGALRSMLTASYAFAASGASLTSNHLTPIVIAVTSILQHPVISTLPDEDVTRLTDHILLTVTRLFGIWSSQGSYPGIAAFNSIITNVAGKAGRRDVLETCLTDMRDIGLQPNAVTRRSILKAAGGIADAELLASSWADLVDFRRLERKQADLGDWQTLMSAARAMGQEDFVRQQLVKVLDEVESHIYNRITGLLQSPPSTRQPDDTDASLEDVHHLIAALLKDTVYIEEQLEVGRFRDFSADPLPLSLISFSPFQSAIEEQIRNVYDELTTDVSLKHGEHTELGGYTELDAFASSEQTELDTPADPENIESDVAAETDAVAQPEEALASETGQDLSAFQTSTSSSPTSLSTTGFTYGDLRYENWKTINELLAEAEKHDRDFMAAIDTAIQNGTHPPKRASGWVTPGTVERSLGLSDLNMPKADSSEATHTSPSEPGEDIRNTVFRLRGRKE